MKHQRLWVALVVALLCIVFASGVLVPVRASVVTSPAAAPTATKKVRPTKTPTKKPTRTPTQTNSTATPSETPPDTATETPPSTATETETLTPVATDTPTDTVVPSETPTETPAVTFQVTETPTEAQTLTETATPSGSETATETPSLSETATETETPTITLTETVTETMTATATVTETPAVTETVTETPTETPIGGSFLAPNALQSTFLVANEDTTISQATLRVYDLNGVVVYTGTQSIAPNGALLIPMPESLPDSFVGSAAVSSAGKLTAVMLNADSNHVASEMYEGAHPNSSTLAFPVFRQLGSGTQKSVIAIQNSDPTASADVYFHFYKANGAEANGSPLSPVTIAPRASYYFDSQTIFGSSDVTYSVSITGTTAIAGAERFSSLQDTAAASAVDETQLGKQFDLTLIERQVQDQNFVSWSEIYVRNTGALQTNLTVSYYERDGTLKGSDTKAINANGFAFIDTRQNAALGASFRGYAILKQTSNQPLAVQWLEANNRGQLLAAYTAQPTNNSGPNWACTDALRSSNPSQFTQFQVYVPGKNSVPVTLTLYDAATGAQKMTKSYNLDPKQLRVIDLSGDAFKGLGNNYRGLAILRATSGRDIVVNAFENYSNKSDAGYSCSTLP